ncbi:MAG TPA: hypothetical protein PKK59_05740 [Anaerolineaceae bacterium]|nr:hypothetical protein [Anaerolineaceae bacterium]
MKKTTAILLVLAFLICLTSIAASSKVRTGEQITMWISHSETFPAGEPFYIAHGWENPVGKMTGLYDFTLSIDGVPIAEDYNENSVIVEPGNPPPWLRKIWVFNFPEGMTGHHTFIAEWGGPCQGLVDLEVIEGPCVKPNEYMVDKVETVVVDFE